MAEGKQVAGVIQVSRRAAERLQAGSVWVYRTDVERGEAGAGAVVEVQDVRGNLLGSGTYSTSSAIAVRLFTSGAESGTEAVGGFVTMVGERVRRSLELREELSLISQVTDARRLVFSEADGLPGVVMDQYGPVVVLQLLTQGVATEAVRGVISAQVQAHFAQVKHGFAQVTEGAETGTEQGTREQVGEGWPVTLWERTDSRIREMEELPLPPTEPLLVMGEEAVGSTVFHVNGLGFHFDVGAGQKTGAFLDQRLNYRAAARAAMEMGGPAARGRALDVCTYQGGFALHLARVCERVTGVDASRVALEVADRNLEANRSAGIAMGEVDWIEADAFALLRAWEEAGERFGTVVLDPPAFAKTKRAVEGAMRGYKEMNLRALRMMEPGGVLVTCSCSHHVSEAEFREAVRGAAVDAGRRVQVLESRGAAPDHPEVMTLPETRYLKCLVCRVE